MFDGVYTVCEWCDSDRYLGGPKRDIVQAKADRDRHNDYEGHFVGGATVEGENV